MWLLPQIHLLRGVLKHVCEINVVKGKKKKRILVMYLCDVAVNIKVRISYPNF